MIIANGNAAMIEEFFKAANPPDISKTRVSNAKRAPQRIFFPFPGFISPLDENMDNAKIPEFDDVMENVINRQMAMKENTIPSGYSRKTTNNTVSVDSTAFAIICLSRFKPRLPKMENHKKDTMDGANITPITNSRMVLPLDILAIKVPTNGPQAIHQAQ